MATINGTENGELLSGTPDADLINGLGGNDTINGDAGNDTIDGGTGDDVIFGGLGDDVINGGIGNDIVTWNISSEGADRVTLGEGLDIVQINANVAGQVRLFFTSSEVGNGVNFDGAVMTNQDGGLAVRAQLEDANGALSGPIGRYDDEGITFIAGGGITFDVRDLVAGTQRGDFFEVVSLGTSAGDTMTATFFGSPYYFNGGAGNDSISGGANTDFLVGGAGDDRLQGAAGADQLLGGGGADTFVFAAGESVAGAFDLILDFTTGVDKIDLSSTGSTLVVLNNVGDQTIVFTGGGPNAQTTFQVTGRVGVNDFGGLGPTTTYSFDLLGDVVDDVLIGSFGSDRLFGGRGSDELRGGDGADLLIGDLGVDLLIGGAGADRFGYRALTDSDRTNGIDVIADFQTGVDKIDLSFLRAQYPNLVFGIGRKDGDSFLFVDVNRDGTSEMVIGIAGNLTVSNTDILF